MKEFKGTPGPWVYAANSAFFDVGQDHREGQPSTVMDVYPLACIGVPFGQEDDARLIAAAPELLEALQEIESWDWEQLRAMPDHIDWKDALEAVDLARHAIAKALGEDHE